MRHPSIVSQRRWKRWCGIGVFARIMEGLASEAEAQKTVMIDVSGHAPLVRACPRKYLKAHRTASSLAVKEGFEAGPWLQCSRVSPPNGPGDRAYAKGGTN